VDNIAGSSFFILPDVLFLVQASLLSLMDRWVPVFSRVVDSSLWDEPDFVVKIFLTMLAKKDADQVVRASAYMIGNWARKTEAEALEALKILSSPDTRRLEPQPHEGRRIQRVEDGWEILNGQYYENLMREVSRKAYKAKKERERRERLKKMSPIEQALAPEASESNVGIDGQ